VKPKKPIDPSGPFDLADLVMHLRASGFRTGTRQYLTANQLLLELAAQGKHLYDITDEPALKELISYLRPIFCHSPEEQARFEDVFKEWIQYIPSRPPRQNIVREYTNPARWLPFWSKLGRIFVGLVLLLLAIFMIQYWFLPKVFKGFITGEDFTTGEKISAPEAKVSFKGQPVKLDNTGGFELKFNRIASPGELIVSLKDHIKDTRIIDINQPSPFQIALKREREEQITDPKEPIQIFKPIVLRLPREPVGKTEMTDWPLAASVSVAAGIASFLFLLVADRLRRRLVLKRLPAEKRPDLLKLAIASQWPEPLSGQQLRRLVGGLRRPREQDILEMDAAQTANASARAVGIFSPVMVHRKQMPEYVVLINRKSADDHQANMIYALMEQLQQYDVSLVCYYFRNDPRVCWRADNPLHRLLLSELAVIHHASTLFVCSESALCFDPISGEPEPWVKKLEEWPNRVLFTPDPPYHWTRREWNLTAAGMIILPATTAGLKTYAELSEDWRIEMLFPAEYARAYPAIIGSDSMRWIDRKAPPPETIKKLLRQLNGFLGPTAFMWLCACGIYPEISLPLTQYLFGAIRKISGSDDRPDLQFKSLSSLARLPWFRYGYMPDWLRVTLINQLTAEQETAVRSHLEALLKRIAERKSPMRGKEGLQVAAWVEPKDILQTAPPGSSMGDCVFLGFMSGANLDRLVVEAPRRFGRWFQRLKRLPKSEIPKAPRSFAQRLMIWFKSQMTFHRNLVRGLVSAVLSALVLFIVVKHPPFTIRSELEEGPPKTIESVAFPRDGRILASAGADQLIRLWEASGGTELATFKGEPLWIKSIAFSRDGKILASGGDDQTVRLWDVETGNEIKRFSGHSGMIFSVAFSPDGKTLASAGADKTIILWDVDTGSEIRRFEGHADRVLSITFSPGDGKILASGGADQTVRLWDVATGSETSRFVGHTNDVFAVTFSPADSNFIASASGDRTVKLWDALTGAEIVTYLGHSDSVFTVAFSPEGNVLVSGGGDSAIIFWDVATGEKLSEIIGGTESVYQLPLALNLTGNKLAAGISDAISLWPIEIKSSKLENLVPDVTGQTLVQARRILNETGLKAGNVTSIRQEGIQGIVVQQDPSPGTRLQEGSAVNLVLTADAKISDDLTPDEKIDHKSSALIIQELKDLYEEWRQVNENVQSRYKQEAKAAIPALIEALKDDNQDVRATAARLLGQIGPDAKEAVPYLMAALRDPSENVRKSAIQALARIGPEAYASESKVIERQKQLPEKATEEKVQTGQLYVETAPENARVRIINIKPKFYQGIELEPGRYLLDVSAEGYESQERWIELGAGEEKRTNVELEKITETTTTRPVSKKEGWVYLGEYKNGTWVEKYFGFPKNTDPQSLVQTQQEVTGNLFVRKGMRDILKKEIIDDLKAGDVVEILEVKDFLAKYWYAHIKYED
jgi:WD40 repeat protein